MQLHAWAGWPGSASGMQCGVEYSWWALRGWPHSAHLSSGLFASVIVTNSKAVYVPPDWYEGTNTEEPLGALAPGPSPTFAADGLRRLGRRVLWLLKTLARTVGRPRHCAGLADA
jgi:hypothetical protein